MWSDPEVAAPAADDVPRRGLAQLRGGGPAFGPDRGDREPARAASAPPDLCGARVLSAFCADPRAAERGVRALLWGGRHAARRRRRAGRLVDLYADRTSIFGEPGEGVEARTEALLAPTPDQADRLRTLACVDVTNGSGGSGFCDAESENGLVVVGACDGPDLVGGIVAAGVASVRLTLGSGVEFTVPARELPAAFGGRRAIGALVPSGEAVREAAALDAAGQVLASTVVGTAPGGQPCAGEDQGGDRFSGHFVPPSPPQGAVAVASAGGESLLVAEQGETLCVALGGFSARICPPPPVDSDRPRLIRRGETVAGALSRDAERITLQLDRGDDVTVRTTDGAAYTGRWSGDVRFFAAQWTPAGR